MKLQEISDRFLTSNKVVFEMEGISVIFEKDPYGLDLFYDKNREREVESIFFDPGKKAVNIKIKAGKGRCDDESDKRKQIHRGTDA